MPPSKNWMCPPWRDVIQRNVCWLLSVRSEPLASWAVPWGFLRLPWLRTTSVGQTLRASWSGPALSSAVDGPESWRRHPLQPRSRAQSSSPVVSPFKTKKKKKRAPDATCKYCVSFRSPAAGKGAGTGMGWVTGRGRPAGLHFCFFLFYIQYYELQSPCYIHIRSSDLIPRSTLLLRVLVINELLFGFFFFWGALCLSLIMAEVLRNLFWDPQLGVRILQILILISQIEQLLKEPKASILQTQKEGV